MNQRHVEFRGELRQPAWELRIQRHGGFRPVFRAIHIVKRDAVDDGVGRRPQFRHLGAQGREVENVDFFPIPPYGLGE